MPEINRLLSACRVPDSLQPAEFGLWAIRRLRCPAAIAPRFGWPTRDDYPRPGHVAATSLLFPEGLR